MAKVTTVWHPKPGQNYGPGCEPQTVRDAYDSVLAQSGDLRAAGEDAEGEKE
jgi:hypothetical protein